MKTKHSPAARRKRKKVLDAAKGFWGDRSKQHRRAEESVRRALAYAYRGGRSPVRVGRASFRDHVVPKGPHSPGSEDWPMCAE